MIEKEEIIKDQEETELLKRRVAELEQTLASRLIRHLPVQTTAIAKQSCLEAGCARHNAVKDRV